MSTPDRSASTPVLDHLRSWRPVVGLVVVVVLLLAGVTPVLAVAVGLAVAVVLVAGAVYGRGGAGRSGDGRPPIDPFALGEPWRHFVQNAQRSRTRLRATVDGLHAGPLRDRLTSTAERLDHAVDETWRIARRGDEIDDAVRRLDPTRLRSQLDTLRRQADSAPTEQLTAAIASVESQLASADRLRQRATETADRLRLSQARLDELVARTSEVAIGAVDTQAYADDVDDLVLEVESLRLALDETGGS
jgi:hypothetical protein